MSYVIAENIRAQADALKPEITADATTGVSTADNAEDVFAKFLPEHINLDIVRDVQDSLLNFAAAQTLAHGEVQQDNLKANPELKSGSLKTKIGHSSIESSYERSRSGNAMGKEWKKYGIAVTDVVLGDGRKKGDYKAVVGYLGEQAASVFAN